MRNISFDNPYWLLLAIPMLAALLIPYFISVSRDNKSRGWVSSLIIHIVIILSISLAAAGLVHTTVKTRTKVYVVADVSYSSSRNLDKIDEYIRQVEASLPDKSYMGIVAFGRDAEILTSSGTAIKSVKEATVDDSGTDIAGALDFTATLFGKDEIKHIILITDGLSTTADGETARAVRSLGAKGIQLDAIYLDNNLKEGESEAQLSDVSYTPATYLGHESRLDMLVESSVQNEVILDLYVKREGEYAKIDTTTLVCEAGMNIASFDLPTDLSGSFDYKVEIIASKDTSPHNNSYFFTQTVAGQRSVLLITEKRADVTAIESLFGEGATVDSYVVSANNGRVPYTIEDLVAYDEIILSNVDVRNIDNIYAFIDSVDLAVSQYGKSLLTLGDLSMQNKDDEIFARLEELLPVNFGNANKDARLYTIVLDISRSMYDTSQFATAKDAALKLLSILGDEDWVAYVTLAGEAVIEQTPVKLGMVRQELYEKIQSAQPIQGTFIGAALKLAYEHMVPLDFAEKQVMLISDGLTFTYEPEDASDIARKMKEDGIILSTVNVIKEEDENYLRNLASLGGGKYYFIQSQDKVSDLIFAEIADDLTESIVEKQSAVNIESYHDDTVKGILSLPDVHGYVNSKAKLDATKVLSVDYVKSNGETATVPLYSYRDHGNGRVATFTSSPSGQWLRGWSDLDKTRLFTNILVTNTPPEYMDYPFNISVDFSGDSAKIEIIPSSVNPKAKASIALTLPDGSVVEREMTFMLNRYSAELDTPLFGKYSIDVTYTYGNHSFTSSTYFTTPYSKEYDAFAAYDIVNIYDFMRGVGQISEDGKLDLTNDKSMVDTYELSFRIPLLILAAVLFVIDVVVRKFKWVDIKGLFAKKQRKEKTNA